MAVEDRGRLAQELTDLQADMEWTDVELSMRLEVSIDDLDDLLSGREVGEDVLIRARKCLDGLT